jgi:hypothetical protein
MIPINTLRGENAELINVKSRRYIMSHAIVFNNVTCAQQCTLAFSLIVMIKNVNTQLIIAVLLNNGKTFLIISCVTSCLLWRAKRQCIVEDSAVRFHML